MADPSKIRVDCGVAAFNNLFLDDLVNPMHLRNTVRLDHEIDAKLLGQAWERTKRVYPVIDCVLAFDEGDVDLYRDPAWREQHSTGHVYLVSPTGGCNVPVQSRVALVPNTDNTAGRLIAVTYFGDTIAVGAYHTLLDGRGFQMVFSTLIYSYLALVTGHEDERPVVELHEGRDLDKYYGAMSPELLLAQDFADEEPYELPAGVHGFFDEDMVEDEGTICAGAIEMDASDFMGLCKACGANPSAMIATLSGRAAYALNPDEEQGVVFGFTISARGILGLEGSIANVVTAAVSYVTRDDVEHSSLAEVAQRVRADLGRQRTRDYCLSFMRHVMSHQAGPAVIARTVTYMGPFTIGDNDSHIVEMGMGTMGSSNLYLFQVQDRFVLAVHYGRATQRYLDEFERIFDELGVRAEVTHPAHLVDLDAEAPVV